MMIKLDFKNAEMLSSKSKLLSVVVQVSPVNKRSVIIINFRENPKEHWNCRFGIALIMYRSVQ